MGRAQDIQRAFEAAAEKHRSPITGRLGTPGTQGDNRETYLPPERGQGVCPACGQTVGEGVPHRERGQR